MGVLKEAWERFSFEGGTTLAAAIGYRAVFALAPLLLVAIAVAGAIFGEQAAQGLLANRLTEFLGPDLAEYVEALLESAAGTTTAGAFGFLILIWAGSGLFNEVQGAMVRIYGVARADVSGWKRAIYQRLVTLASVLASALGLVVLVGVAAASAWIPDGPGLIGPVAAAAVLLIGIVLSFRYFTPFRPSWRVAVGGGFITEVAMFGAGAVVGLFVARGGGGSATGIAGSAVAILLLVYVLAAVYLLGASLTRSLAGPADATDL